jgi:hypothetical protein
MSRARSRAKAKAAYILTLNFLCNLHMGPIS